jgi:hypothetical protein
MKTGYGSRQAVGALCALAALAFASCAAPLRFGAEADPLSLLAPDLAVYLRLDGAEARLLLPEVLSAEEAASLAPLLERTRVAALGLGAADPSGARRLEAAFVGDYPYRRARLGLASGSGWRREDSAYYHEATGLRALPAGPDLVLASSSSIEGLLARAKEPPASPIPARFEQLAGRELVLWMPDPLGGVLSEIFGGEEGDPPFPLRGFFAAATPKASDAYSASVCFLMESAEQARLLRPALRLAWYFLAGSVFGDDAGPALDARFSLDGELVYAPEVDLPRAALLRALAAVAKSRGAGEEPPATR